MVAGGPDAFAVGFRSMSEQKKKQQQTSGKKPKTAIQPTREENYAEWYQQVVKAADMAETSAVRGCMVIKPWGYAVWENIQRGLDDMFKATGHQNAYFPLFILLLSGEGGRARRRIRQGMRGGDTPPTRTGRGRWSQAGR